MDMITLSIGIFLGSVMTLTIIALGSWVIASNKKVDVQQAGKRMIPALIAVVVALAVALPQAAFAQATPVPLEIPTNVIFTETNNWLQTFAPIAAIGIGITLALAVLGYIGKLIASAFR